MRTRQAVFSSLARERAAIPAPLRSRLVQCDSLIGFLYEMEGLPVRKCLSLPIVFPLRPKTLLQAFEIRIRFHLHHPHILAARATLAHNALGHAILPIADGFEKSSSELARVDDSRSRQMTKVGHELVRTHKTVAFDPHVEQHSS